jgi:hypothetical protein
MNSYHLLNKRAAAFDKVDTAALRPHSVRDTAIAGGLGGSLLGGLAGAGKAVFDSEDDGLLSTLKKILGGAAIGGGIGASSGGGIAAVRKDTAEKKLLEAVAARAQNTNPIRQGARIVGGLTSPSQSVPLFPPGMSENGPPDWKELARQLKQEAEAGLDEGRQGAV